MVSANVPLSRVVMAQKRENNCDGNALAKIENFEDGYSSAGLEQTCVLNVPRANPMAFQDLEEETE